VSQQPPPLRASTYRRCGLRDLESTTLLSLAAGGALGVIRYRRDLRRDQNRLAAIRRAVIDTGFGRVEYTQDGDGPPVLIVHGVLGGCDFGIGPGRASIPAGYRIISPSRFGYLGSPMPTDPSPASQADAFAALLDHLELADAAVVGFSAGSSSTLQLALRHPNRVSRLMLISPNAAAARAGIAARRTGSILPTGCGCSGRPAPAAHAQDQPYRAAHRVQRGRPSCMRSRFTCSVLASSRSQRSLRSRAGLIPRRCPSRSARAMIYLNGVPSGMTSLFDQQPGSSSRVNW
jgi:pimeloyl-ACP methyl ester carboxylesterase